VRKLRVLHFGKFYPPHRGGMETVVASLCRGLAAKGLDCRVIAADDGSGARSFSADGVRIRRLRSFGTVNSLPICPGAVCALRGIEADVVNLHHPNPLADISCLLSNANARIVVTYHSDIIRQRRLSRLHSPLLRQTLRRADAIVATSAQYAASSPVLKEFRRKVRVIPLGYSPPSAASTHAAFDGARREPQYLFIGRLVPYKGIPVLLQALQMVPGRLWIVGTGPLKAALEGLPARAALDGRIEFLGDVSEEEKLCRLSECDALVLPSTSRAEAFGIVLLEAMAMSRPVVVSDLPTGVRMLVEDGVNGYRFPPGDAAALAASLQRLASDPARARQMGDEGRRRFLERWTMDRMVNAYVQLYDALCSARAARRPAMRLQASVNRARPGEAA
jgi:rhamnosyl/mannosyltransferase